MAETLLDRKLGTGSLVTKLAGLPIDLDELGPVSIRHGRSKPDGQPDASTVTLVTKAARIPEVGQDLTVELGPTARAALGLPAYDLTNLLTNPAHSDGVAGYATPSGMTSSILTGLTVGGLTGVRAVRFTTTALITAVDAIQSRLHLAGLLPFPGAVYSGSLWVRSSIAANLRLQVNWHDAAGTYLTSSLSFPTTAVAPNVWTQLTLANVATPANAVQGAIFLDSEEPMDWTAGSTLDATLGTWGPGSAPFPPFDGATPDTADLDYSWVGTPNASASTQVAKAARRFTGKVTRAQLIPEPGTKSSRRRVQVTAASPVARLGRQYVGDAPWPAELDGARVARLLALATGVTAGAVDSGTVSILARDVDRQPLLKLAQEVADDADGLLAQLRDGRVVYHDGDHRQLVAVSLDLAATEVLWPVVWTQDLEGMVNDLTVAYGPASPQAEWREVDDQAVAAFGLYAAKVSTQLADAAAAEAYALLTTARRGRPWWDLSTVTVELVRSLDGGLHDRATRLLALEVSDLVRIVGWPTSGPQQLGRLWVEGWTESITSSSWRMVLAVTPYGRTGPAARWVDVTSTVTWATFPALTWAQLASWDPGTGPSAAWFGAPSDLTWAEAPATTWAAWPY